MRIQTLHLMSILPISVPILRSQLSNLNQSRFKKPLKIRIKILRMPRTKLGHMAIMIMVNSRILGRKSSKVSIITKL